MLASKSCHLYPVTILCLELETCVNKWGEGLCIAPTLPSQDGPDQKKCFNTFSTCLNKFQKYQAADGTDTSDPCGQKEGLTQVEGYKCGTKRHYFSTCEISKEMIAYLESPSGGDGIYLGPVIKDVKYKTGSLSSENPLATRSTLNVTMSDFDHSEQGIDPYFKDRKWFKINSANAKPAGTFWPRFLTRNKYYKNSIVNIYEGDCEFTTLSEFDQSLFIVQSLDGLDNNNCVSLKALDPFDLADDKESVCPAPFTDENGQPWQVTRTISETQVGNMPLTNVDWYGDDEAYIGYHYNLQQQDGKDSFLCIGKEIIRGRIKAVTAPQFCTPYYATNSARIVFVAVERGALGSEVAEHDIGDTATLAMCFAAGQNTACIIQNVLTMCTDINKRETVCCEEDRFNLIEFKSAEEINCDAIKSLLCDVVICKPIKVRKLLKELADQFGFRIWYDDKKQKVTWETFKPPNDCTLLHFNECDYEDKTFTIKKRKSKQYNAVSFHYDAKNVGEGVEDDNFYKICTVIDADAVNCAAGGELVVKDIYSRWMCDASKFLMKAQARKLLNQNACDIYDLSMVVDKCAIRNSDQNQNLCIGTFFTVENCQLQDICGYTDDEGTQKIWQVTQMEPKDDGCLIVKAESTEFTSEQCWLTHLCGQSPTCGEPLTPNTVEPLLVEANHYYCKCRIY